MGSSADTIETSKRAELSEQTGTQESGASGFTISKVLATLCVVLIVGMLLGSVALLSSIFLSSSPSSSPHYITGNLSERLSLTHSQATEAESTTKASLEPEKAASGSIWGVCRTKIKAHPLLSAAAIISATLLAAAIVVCCVLLIPQSRAVGSASARSDGDMDVLEHNTGLPVPFYKTPGFIIGAVWFLAGVWYSVHKYFFEPGGFHLSHFPIYLIVGLPFMVLWLLCISLFQVLSLIVKSVDGKPGRCRKFFFCLVFIPYLFFEVLGMSIAFIQLCVFTAYKFVGSKICRSANKKSSYAALKAGIIILISRDTLISCFKYIHDGDKAPIEKVLAPGYVPR